MEDPMTASISEAVLGYLNGERRMGRLATADADGLPHVVPIGMWRYNADLGTLDIGGRDLAATRKFHNVQANKQAAFVVDDMASVDPWRPRAVMVQGGAEAIENDAGSGHSLIRLLPDKIISWGL